MNAVAEVLDGAADLISPPGCWIQGVNRSEEEDGTNAYCALGALAEATRRLGVDTRVMLIARDVAHRHLLDVYGTSLAMYNDAPGRTAAEVVAGLRGAAVEVREGEDG